MRRLAVTKILVENHQLKLVSKILYITRKLGKKMRHLKTTTVLLTVSTLGLIKKWTDKQIQI